MTVPFSITDFIISGEKPRSAIRLKTCPENENFKPPSKLYWYYSMNFGFFKEISYAVAKEVSPEVMSKSVSEEREW